MIATIIGMKSHISSEKFQYVFPKDSVSFIDKRQLMKEKENKIKIMMMTFLLIVFVVNKIER